LNGAPRPSQRREDGGIVLFDPRKDLLMMRTTPLDILVKIGMVVNAIVIALLLAYYFSS